MATETARKSSNKVIFRSCVNMKEVVDGDASLVIVSPPYVDGINGKLDKKSYHAFLEKVFCEVHRILSKDGVLVSINTDLRDHAKYNGNMRGADGTVWFKHADIREIAESVGFKCVECKIWVKSLNINVYRYNFSYILFFTKTGRPPFRPGTSSRNKKMRSDVWLLSRGTTRTDSHGLKFRDAIHPEIVRRCLEEFTKEQDLVVSPFTGSGTILAVAEKMSRNWIGYETNKKLKRLINESIFKSTDSPLFSGQWQD
jgi:DNA modification methylase